MPAQEFTFVLRTQEDNESARKKQLKSVINTHVAFRAHEQRRERKKRQNKSAGISQESSTSPEVEASADSFPKPHDDGNSESTSSTLADESLFDQILSVPALSYDRERVKKQLNELYSDQQTFHNTQQDFRSNQSEGDQISLPRRQSNGALIPLGISRNVVNWSAISRLSVNGNALDPFTKLPMTLDSNDQSLLRYWYTDAQTLMFGIDAASPFCPLRDWSYQNVHIHDIALQWVLVSAEQHLAHMRHTKPPNSLLKRRAQGYAALNEILNKPSVDLDKAYVGIIMAIMADSISGETELLKMHVKGLDLLLHERGGIQSLLETPLAALPPFCVTMQYTYAECDVQNLLELELIKSRFMRTLRSLRAHTLKMRAVLREAQLVPNTSREDENEVPIRGNSEDSERVATYSALKKDVFFSSCISHIIWTPYDHTATFSQTSGQFMILLSLGLTLMYFGDKHLVKTVFLKRLNFMAQRVSAIDPRTGSSLLLPAQLASMISHVRQEVQGHFDDRIKVLAEEVKACAVVIDGLKMFGFLSHANRAKLIDLLRGWVFMVATKEDQEKDEEMLASISAEIVQIWLQHHSMMITRECYDGEREEQENG